MKVIRIIIKDQKGAAIVEFAIILPFLVLLVAGVIEFSLLFYNKQIITNASKEGARIGVADYYVDPISGDLEDVDEDYIKDRVEIYCTDRLITFGSANLPNTETEFVGPAFADGTYLTVTVTYDYKFLLPSLINVSPTITLTAETVMMNMGD